MLEICVDNIESVQNAYRGGANRIELCSALCDGGLTPTLGFLKVIKKEFPDLNVFAMLRPRGGSDFQYSDREMQMILADMQDFREAGVDGFVFGALDANRRIDETSCRRVIAAAVALPVTFHRAFDLTDPHDLITNAQTIKRLGFHRLLTSGLAATAYDGLANICRLTDAMSDLIILPGSGINVTNARKILIASGCKEFHCSGRRSLEATNTSKNGIDFGRSLYSDAETIEQLVQIGRETRCNSIVN